jgi:hypothetical protein
VLKSLVSHLRSSLTWIAERRGRDVHVEGRWTPEPVLIRMQLKDSQQRPSFFHLLQQPLGTLLVGTILGSLLIPQINDLTNRRKSRHDERLKMAVTIIEQSHESDRNLQRMIDYLALFRKDHNDPSASKEFLKGEQYTARKAFNEMYMSFNGQAWFWLGNVKSEANLSGLATSVESQRVSEASNEYANALAQAAQAVTTLWDPFLKNLYNPADPSNDILIKQAAASLEAARKRRVAAALQMARVFSSE